MKKKIFLISVIFSVAMLTSCFGREVSTEIDAVRLATIYSEQNLYYDVSGCDAEATLKNGVWTVEFTFENKGSQFCGPVVKIKQSNGKVIDGYTRK